MQCPTYFWLEKERIKREIIKPKYFKDLVNISFKKKFLIFFKPKFIYYSILYFIFNFFRKVKFLNYYFVKLAIKKILRENNISVSQIEFYDHHLCHAASALSQYNFDYNQDNFVFVLDEHGDQKHSSFFKWTKKQFILISSSQVKKFSYENQTYVTSIGNLYSNFTEALGLRRSTDEGKVEALAAYGQYDKELFNLLKSIIKVDLNELNFNINFDLYKKHLNVNNLKKKLNLIGDKNFAATIQFFLEYIVIKLLVSAKKKYQFNELFVTGGVFANVILSYKIYETLRLKKINVIPFMGDEGSAVGAAILSLMKENIKTDFLSKNIMPYLGTEYSENQILDALKHFEAKIDFTRLDDNQIAREASDALYKNYIICTFFGKMEFGPRALGNRSILANPFYKETRDKINLKIKKRPWYQPLCPTILEDDRNAIFENSFNHKFMSTAFKAKEEMKKIIPSALHVDCTARPQFVNENDNVYIYNILKKMKEKYSYGVILNTSFNMHGRTNVLTPENAITDFLDCNLDEMYVGNYKVNRK